MSGIPSWVRPGRRCVCVNIDRTPFDVVDKGVLAVGAVYTISRAYIHFIARVPVVDLDETAHLQICHLLSRFRPLVEDSGKNGIEAQFYHKRGLTSKSPIREVKAA